jgi:hypothetical protein
MKEDARHYLSRQLHDPQGAKDIRPAQAWPFSQKQLPEQDPVPIQQEPDTVFSALFRFEKIV